MDIKKIIRQNKLNIAGVLVCLVIASIYLSITWPKPVQFEMKGIEYSQAEKDFCKTVKIKVEGTTKREMTVGRVFTGTIAVEGSDVSLPTDQMMLSFGKTDWTELTFRNLDGQFFDYGELFADPDMKSIVIVEPYGGKPGDGRPEGEPGDNKILVFPARDRADAEKTAKAYFQKQREEAESFQ